MENQFIAAFTEEVKDQLLAGNSVKIETLGSFGVQHKKQNQKTEKNGRVILEPPADVITFKPEKSK